MGNTRRRQTKTIKVRDLFIGGDNPVSIQTMWKNPLTAVSAEVIDTINAYHTLGCDLLRFSVPDMNTAGLLLALAKRVEMPLVADIHFDYKLALRCLDGAIAKIRINPGNIGSRWKVEEVVRKAADKGVPIRVGVNAGSLPLILRKEPDKAKAMVQAAEMEIDILRSMDFEDMLFSLKASDVETTVKANLLFSQRYDNPLHLGVTEAGPLIPGTIKNSVALSELLKRGIGDTIRVSLSDSSEKELAVGRELLSVLGLRNAVEIISCPRCGRSTFDVHSFVKELEPHVNKLQRKIKIAVMGCVVNGPGEAKGADLGIAGAGNEIVIFKKGEVLRKVTKKEALEIFIKEMESL